MWQISGEDTQLMLDVVIPVCESWVKYGEINTNIGSGLVKL